MARYYVVIIDDTIVESGAGAAPALNEALAELSKKYRNIRWKFKKTNWGHRYKFPKEMRD